MNEPTEPRNVIYYPPSKEAIEAYAAKVCKVMGEQFGEEYSDQEMQEGLATFMKLVVKAKIKQLNGGTNRKEKAA